MQAPFTQTNDEDHFTNTFYSKSIECIIPTAELLVNFKTNGIHTKKPCLLYAEKMDFKGLIQLRFTEKCDRRRMYITTVDSGSFSELKHDQSLHVTFTGFVENLVNILQDCQTGKLEIYLVQIAPSSNASCMHNNNGVSNNINEFQVQFLELRPFKNLTHLCLPCRLAPLNIVLFYMNSQLDELEKQTTSQDRTAHQFQQELQLQQRRIEQLEAENSKLRNTAMEDAHNLNQKHAEELRKLQENINKMTEQQYKDNECHRKTITTLQIQIDKIKLEKKTLQTEKMQELQRFDALKEELLSTNTQLTQLKTQSEQLQTEIATLKNEERKNEMHMTDTRKHINELQEKLKKYDKNKADIIAELEAEKKISQTKRQALEVATEEISKANEIIMKQTQELIKLRKTIAWRTEIALEQEKAIQEKEKELSLYDEELKETRIIVNSLRNEVPQQLESLRQFANSLERKYKAEINALRETLNSQEGETTTAMYAKRMSNSRK